MHTESSRMQCRGSQDHDGAHLGNSESRDGHASRWQVISYSSLFYLQTHATGECVQRSYERTVRSYSEQEKALMKLDRGTTTQKSFIFDGLMRICQNIPEFNESGMRELIMHLTRE